MNTDFAEILSAFCEAGVEFLIVGAYALATHGYVRATGDLDIWVRPSPENASRVWAALQAFGAPLQELHPRDFHTADLVLQIGVAPSRVDILTSITGVSFEEAWQHRRVISVEGVEVPVLGRDQLIANKLATGRTRDLADVEELTGRKP